MIAWILYTLGVFVGAVAIGISDPQGGLGFISAGLILGGLIYLISQIDD